MIINKLHMICAARVAESEIRFSAPSLEQFCDSCHRLQAGNILRIWFQPKFSDPELWSLTFSDWLFSFYRAVSLIEGSIFSKSCSRLSFHLKHRLQRGRCAFNSQAASSKNLPGGGSGIVATVLLWLLIKTFFDSDSWLFKIFPIPELWNPFFCLTLSP